MTFTLRGTDPGRFPRPAAFSVMLIDRRTGVPHRINGTPLVIFTKDPGGAVAELLHGRDATVWEARIEQLAGGPR
jgi:hypothetical protein